MKSRATIYVAPVASDIEKVAIMPFKAPTELIGSTVSDLFVTEMLKTQRYTLVERSQITKVLKESELVMSGISAAEAVEVGSMLGADGVIIGTVHEYGTVPHRGYAYPSVGMSARLIDCKSGEVVWSADLAAKAEKTRRGIPTLTEHARETVHELTAGLYQNWGRQRRRPRGRRRSRSKPVGDANAPVGRAPDVAPETPRNVSASEMGLREVTVTWDSPVDAPSKYQIERSETKTGPFEAVARVSPHGKTYLDRGDRGRPLDDGKTYFYRVIAVSAGGLKSPPSQAVGSMTAPPPDPPANIRAEASGSREVTVTWEPPGSEGVERYIVERARAPGQNGYEELVRTASTIYKDGGTSRSDLDDSTIYVYRLTSINRVGSVGMASAPAKVKTLPPPAPIESFVAESEQVRCVPLSWSPSEESDVIRYEIFRSNEREGEYESIASVNGRLTDSYLDGRTDPGILEDSATYYYKMIAHNKVGSQSRDSKIISATTRSPPPVVTGVRAEARHPRRVPVSWEESPDEKVIGYEIWRAPEGSDDFVKIETVSGRNVTEYVDEGDQRSGVSLFRGRREPGAHGDLEDSTTYRYSIIAFNTAQAKSDWSDPAEATTKPAPAKPLALLATTEKAESIEVSWARNSENDIARYVVEVAEGSSDRFRPLTTVHLGVDNDFSAVDHGVPHGEARRYRVKAVDEDELESEWSDAEEGRAKPLPDAPTDVEVAYEDAICRLTWSSPPQPDVEKYNIWEKGFIGTKLLGSADFAQYELAAEDIGRAANIYVTAVDKDGLESLPSDVITVDTRVVAE